MMVRKGKIVDFEGTWGSGLATLVIKDSETGKEMRLSCENTPTVRAFVDAYGREVIGAGHTVNVNELKGKEIYWTKGEWIDFGGFVPVELATPDLIEKYEKDKEARAKKKLGEMI